MPPKALSVSEARRNLPSLVRRVVHGATVVTIGPRGQPAVVLLGIDEYEALRARARAATPESGWERLRMELVGTTEELQADLRKLRAEAEAEDGRGPRPRRRSVPR